MRRSRCGIGRYLALAEALLAAEATGLGAWTAAYIFTKILQPVRIGITLLLTPLLARLYERVRVAKR